MAYAKSLVARDGLISVAERDAVLAERAQDLLDSGVRRLLILPPDHTRANSDAGPITDFLWRRLHAAMDIDIMPTLGTHMPMSERELRFMFGENIPLDAFRVHDWRNDIRSLGQVPGSLVADWSEGRVDYPVDVEVNRILTEGYDAILSVGQVVPHEVVGMANYTKNVCVGAGGFDIINKSHFLGAVYGMERIMGRRDTPVRRLYNYAVDQFMADLPISYLLTVMATDRETGTFGMKGLFAGDTEETFNQAAALSQETNIIQLDAPLEKVVVFLDPEEFRSTWLGNKAIYRTRMAMADQGELIVLAPGLAQFGEDPEVDKLIRKHGYRGTRATLAAVASDSALAASLGAAAHLVHGSTEDRFRVTYCPGGGVPLETVRSVGFAAAPLKEMAARYNPAVLRDGRNVLPDGEEVFFVSNPALGLWGLKRDFQPKQPNHGTKPA
jgi:nickel-dependent lactate racemase